jgi:DNA polymerase-3 subunit delta'
MTVWDELVGQEHVAEQLREAVAGAAQLLAGRTTSQMTHAWLFTGPPGSGRSTAARAFAAALQCEQLGCGTCLACRTALAGSHPDVTSVVTEQSVIRVDAAREAVRVAALAPVSRRWQVVVVEDADRLNDHSANALLKSIEEPPGRTVWLLCAPTVEDVLPTIRSRCRTVVLRTPTASAVAGHLVRRDGVAEGVATFAARAAQGHIGRARGLALDESARSRRREVLEIPTQLRDLGACMTAAANLVEAAEEEAKPRSERLDAQELADLDASYGAGTRGVRTTGYGAAHKALLSTQRQRAKRIVRDCVDRYLLDLASFYRDVVAIQLGAESQLINEELRPQIASMARATSAETSAGRLAAIFATREALEGEVAPLLALESLIISLKGGADE